MKKISCGIMMIAGIISIILIIMYDSKKEIILSEKRISKLKKEQIAMMYETELGSGEYIASNNSKWPQEGYVFNENLSKCEKGSKIRWDGTKNNVVLEGNISDKCYIYFDVGNYASSYIKSLYTTDGVNGLYLHDADLANGANDGSLRYAGGEYRIKEEYLTTKYAPIPDGLVSLYCVYEDDEYKQTYYDGWDDEAIKMSECVSIYYLLNYDTNMIHYATFEEAIVKAISDGYVEKTTPINNYVCFGTDEENCPEDNLYRIIGVFDNKVKLIKATRANTTLLGIDGDYYSYVGRDSNFYYWNYDNYNNSILINDWRNSHLNTINLNKNYLNNIGNKWSDMIATHTWNIGGLAYNSNLTANAAFNLELGICSECTGKEMITQAKIGLIYVSDYMYAQDPTFWTVISSQTNKTRDSNWMYLSNGINNIWTISRYTDANDYAWRITERGQVNYSTTLVNGGGYVFPTFYLNSNVKITSGEGTKANPYRIA